MEKWASVMLIAGLRGRWNDKKREGGSIASKVLGFVA
jgi:hypothetical protein